MIEILFLELIWLLIWVNVIKIVCGMNGGFVIVDVEMGSIEDIVGLGVIGMMGGGGGMGCFGLVSVIGMLYMGLGSYIFKLLFIKFVEGGLLFVKDINILFIDDFGRVLEKY